MKFEIHRTSDLNDGRATALTEPCHDAAFDAEENRWVIELTTMEELLELAQEVDAHLYIIPVSTPVSEPDLPIVEIEDEERAVDENYQNMMNVVQAAIDWAEDTGDCHFCGEYQRTEGARHEEECPLFPIHDMSLITEVDLKAANKAVMNEAQSWTDSLTVEGLRSTHKLTEKQAKRALISLRAMASALPPKPRKKKTHA